MKLANFNRPLLDIMSKNVTLNSLEENVKVAELNWWDAHSFAPMGGY